MSPVSPGDACCCPASPSDICTACPAPGAEKPSALPGLNEAIRTRGERQGCACSVAFAAVTTGDELRALMRLWPHGVSILSVDVEGDRMGVTVSSLVSLSLEPPLIGVSIGKDASCYELLRSAGRFAVSLLGSEQEELARRFAAGYPPIVHWQ